MKDCDRPSDFLTAEKKVRAYIELGDGLFEGATVGLTVASFHSSLQSAPDFNIWRLPK